MAIARVTMAMNDSVTPAEGEAAAAPDLACAAVGCVGAGVVSGGTDGGDDGAVAATVGGGRISPSPRGHAGRAWRGGIELT